MYTASLKSKTFQRAANRILVVVEVTDGTTPFDKEFSFAPNTEVDAMKRTVKQYLDELNGAADKVTALDNLNYAEPAEDTPTQAELDKQAWQKDRAKLATIMELVRDGVFTGSEKPITDLQAKVKTNFKPEFLN